MRDLIIIEFLSLDGVMQGYGGPEEDTSGGFAHGGWGAAYQDHVIGETAGRGMAATDAFLFGRRTYDKMAAYWPTGPADNPITEHLNSSAKYVASRSPRTLEWKNTVQLEGDATAAVTRLKEQDGGTIAVLGSGDLAQTLIRDDLVDEYLLFVHPLLLGGGKRLFRDAPSPRPLRLLDVRPTTTGTLVLRYRPEKIGDRR